MQRLRRQPRGRRSTLWAAALLVPTLLALAVSAPAEDRSESAVVAAYLYNFAKFVEWPNSTWTAVDEPLVIGVLGTPSLAAELATHLQGRTIQGHPVAVWPAPSRSRLQSCHLLWIRELPPELSEAALFDSLRGKPVLTVGSEIGFARRGGMISLYVESDRMRFAINQGAAARGGLKISSKLLALAQTVEGEAGQ